MIRIATVVLVLAVFGSNAAHADSTYTSRLSNGYTSTTKCTKSFYNGTTCATTSSGDILARSNDKPLVIKEDGPRAGADWAAKCKKSCYDASGDN